MQSDIKKFRLFGAGPYLYFLFVKNCIVIFAVLGLLSLVPIVYNRIAGTAYSSSSWGLNIALARFTIGAHTAAAFNQYEAKLVNLISACISLVGLICFWIYWKHKL